MSDNVDRSDNVVFDIAGEFEYCHGFGGAGKATASWSGLGILPSWFKASNEPMDGRLRRLPSRSNLTPLYGMGPSTSASGLLRLCWSRHAPWLQLSSCPISSDIRGLLARVLEATASELSKVVVIGMPAGGRFRAFKLRIKSLLFDLDNGFLSSFGCRMRKSKM